MRADQRAVPRASFRVERDAWGADTDNASDDEEGGGEGCGVRSARAGGRACRNAADTARDALIARPGVHRERGGCKGRARRLHRPEFEVVANRLSAAGSGGQAPEWREHRRVVRAAARECASLRLRAARLPFDNSRCGRVAGAACWWEHCNVMRVRFGRGHRAEGLREPTADGEQHAGAAERERDGACVY